MSPLYAAFTVWVPAVPEPGVMATEQVAIPVVVPGDREQVAGVVRKSVLIWTVPVGVVGMPVVERSLTVAVHIESWFMTTGFVQLTLVKVGWGSVRGETTFRIVKPVLKV